MNHQGDRDAAVSPRAGHAESGDGQTPLCVDLDGTLVKTDLLLESAIALLKANPLYLFLFPVWLLQGKAHLKRQIAERARLNAECLPYHAEFLAFLREQHRTGRRLVLASASDERLAMQVARHLGLFGEVIASDGVNNLSGQRKCEALRTRFGAAGFAYAGNGKVDLPVWAGAGGCVVVNASPRLAARASRTAPPLRVFARDAGAGARVRAFLEAIRVHQWVKNLLVFVPLLTAHQLADVVVLSSAALAFVAFSLCSSSVYLLNDLLDLEADRQHPTKRNRPFASGELSLLTGMVAIPLLLLASIGLALLLPADFLLALLAYFALTLAYSFHLKQVVLLDVVVLAILYTTRIIAGAVAIAVPVSPWLLAFSMFLFLSLALVKRFAELRALRVANKQNAKGRGYSAGDLEQLASLGAASGYVSVMVLALYINSHEVTVLYKNPAALWLICPVILYWVSRVWLLAHRGQMHQDPIVFAIKDRGSYAVAAFIGAAMLLAL